MQNPEPEVTVVIATHNGATRIERALHSLARQTVPAGTFETIVVQNGGDDGTGALISNLRALEFPARLRLVTTPHASAARARNLGIAAAVGRYLTFLDDDDVVSPDYLRGLLQLASTKSVAVASVADWVKSVDDATFDTYLNRSVYAFAGAKAKFAALHNIAAANGGKLVPTHLARRHRFPELNSGEDVVFWAGLFAAEDPEIRVTAPGNAVTYFRQVRPDSVSRRPGLNHALDRIPVISALSELEARHPEAKAPLRRLINAQAGQMGEHLKRAPVDRPEILRAIAAAGVPDFPYGPMNTRATDKLVVAYAFPPYNDTSGIVVARRIAASQEPVDVVTQAMDNIRQRDAGTYELVRTSVGSVMTVPGSAAFASWARISAFVHEAEELVELKEAKRGLPYAQLYSRSMLPAAHIFGALKKLRTPGIVWTAEFSDPMRSDSEGKERNTSIPDDDPLFNEIESLLQLRSVPATESRNMWEWIETLVYALADEIIFTNPLQHEFMRSYAPQRLVERLESKAVIAPHPTLPPEYYSAVQATYELPADRINIGYFGVFYKLRGAGDILSAVAHLSTRERKRIMFHIFTNKPEETQEEVRKLGLNDHVAVNGYLPYLDFLACAKDFDWLVVSDARVKAHHQINPYLPSKYSDYSGAGSKIWSIYEEGSMLSLLPADLHTPVGDRDAILAALRNILARKTSPAGGDETDTSKESGARGAA